MRIPFRTIAVLAAVVATAAEAKRAAPPVVPPVVWQDVTIRAPNEDGRIGLIVASDTATGREVWRKMLYRVTISPKAEEDAQGDFILTMAVKDGRLFVTTEKGLEFVVPLAGRKP